MTFPPSNRPTQTCLIYTVTWAVAITANSGCKMEVKRIGSLVRMNVVSPSTSVVVRSHINMTWQSANTRQLYDINNG